MGIDRGGGFGNTVPLKMNEQANGHLDVLMACTGLEIGDRQGCILAVCRDGAEKAQCRRKILFEGLKASSVNKVLGMIGKTQRMTLLNTLGDGFDVPVDFIMRDENGDEYRVGTRIWLDGTGNHVIVGLQNLRWLLLMPANSSKLVKNGVPVIDSGLVVGLS
ncbi:hypothetical protein BGY98DRAFT_327031 [Russula aff. rugulosa BPL654]|nr:hypothetical protein BGY98DRAFT_327031 [Russula aff. rugulosa BPL654]